MDWLTWVDGKPVVDYDKLDKWLEDEKEVSRSQRLQADLDYAESHIRGLENDLSDAKQRVRDLEQEVAELKRQFELYETRS